MGNYSNLSVFFSISQNLHRQIFFTFLVGVRDLNASRPPCRPSRGHQANCQAKHEQTHTSTHIHIIVYFGISFVAHNLYFFASRDAAHLIRVIDIWDPTRTEPSCLLWFLCPVPFCVVLPCKLCVSCKWIFLKEGAQNLKPRIWKALRALS